jgi:hypothetical protein
MPFAAERLSGWTMGVRYLFGGSKSMAINVETKDCTALSDAEFAEMADMCVDGPARFEVGMLSKQAEMWVLVSQAREGTRLKGFSFCTLERIGGTPCVLIGLASVKRTSKRDSVLRALMLDQYRRAVLAFPDEDVLVDTRFSNAGGFEAFRTLEEIIPRPDHRVTGEERAWGRRLAKRFECDSGYDEQAFAVKSNGQKGFIDYESAKPDSVDRALTELFKAAPKDCGALIVYGWTMAEDLVKLGART